MKFEHFSNITKDFKLGELPQSLTDTSAIFAQMSDLAHEYNTLIDSINSSSEVLTNELTHSRIEGIIAQYDCLYSLVFNLIENDIKGSLGLFVESTIRANKIRENE